MNFRHWLAAAAVAASPFAATPALAQGEVVVYCSVQEEWCRPMVAAFEKATGIKVLMTRKSSGEFYAQIKAESANPKGDVWWGGTGDPHLQAAEELLTDPYTSPVLNDLQDWAVQPGQGVQVPHRRHLRGRSRLQLQRHGAGQESCPSPSAGPTWSSPPSRTRCRSPTRTRRARRTRCWPRWCS
jgi:hypothetical protein